MVDRRVKYIGIRLEKQSPMAGVRLIDFASRFGLKTEPARHVLIIGGGRIGERLAGKLEKDDIKTRIIEVGYPALPLSV